eukprot:g23656.t2
MLVSRKLHQAEEKTKLDIAVSEDQRELLRNFRKIVTRTVENEESAEIQSKNLFVFIVETDPVLRAEVSQLCQLLEYRCKAFGSLTAAESEISHLTESAGSTTERSPTFLVLLGTSWLDRDLPYEFKQDAARRTLATAAFLVCETLGRGSSGIVHRVKRLRDGQILAMKEVPTRLLREKERQSLLQEVSLMQSFSWPSIISLVCAWENPQQRMHYIVMPFSEGGSLKSRISQALVQDVEGLEHCTRSNSSLSLRGQHLGAWYVQSLHVNQLTHLELFSTAAAISYGRPVVFMSELWTEDNLMLGHGGITLQICDLGSAMRLPSGDKDSYLSLRLIAPDTALPVGVVGACVAATAAGAANAPALSWLPALNTVAASASAVGLCGCAALIGVAGLYTVLRDQSRCVCPVVVGGSSAHQVSKWHRAYAASDMWSLGATFYEVITLQSLAPTNSPQEKKQLEKSFLGHLLAMG